MTTPFAHITFIEDAALVLADHPRYVWNRAQTRIRCSGTSCAEILDVDAGPDGGDAGDIFAIHQAEMLSAPLGEGNQVAAEGRQSTCRHCHKPLEVRDNQWTHLLTASGPCDSPSNRFSPFPAMAAPMPGGD